MPNAVIPSGFRTGCHTSVPRTGSPSMSSIRSVFTKCLQDDGVDCILTVDALLEVRDSRPRVERVVAEPRETVAHLVREGPFEREPLVARRLAEQPVVQLVQTAQLVDRALVVVDAEIDEDVGQLRVPAVPLHDEQRRRLLAA